jgi:hypothetical protein
MSATFTVPLYQWVEAFDWVSSAVASPVHSERHAKGLHLIADAGLPHYGPDFEPIQAPLMSVTMLATDRVRLAWATVTGARVESWDGREDGCVVSMDRRTAKRAVSAGIGDDIGAWVSVTSRDDLLTLAVINDSDGHRYEAPVPSREPLPLNAIAQHTTPTDGPLQPIAPSTLLPVVKAALKWGGESMRMRSNGRGGVIVSRRPLGDVGVLMSAIAMGVAPR